MKISSGIAALAGVLVLICGLVAWEWYSHLRGSRPNVQPVQQIAAPTPMTSPTSVPVTYLPQRAHPASVEPSAPRPAPTVYTAVPRVSAPARPTSTPAVALKEYAAGGSPVILDEPMVAATIAPHALSVKPVLEVPSALPRILAMSLSTPVAHGGDVVSGIVETTSNVATVEARIGGFASSMQKVGVGRFALTYRVPNLPFFLHRTYTIVVIARNSRGDEVRSSVPIVIR